ncbi:hypothetical protein MKX01_033067 [Papaver californicum]|nr:hypothetical protein MKX01_033067 [Papaver californicum]
MENIKNGPEEAKPNVSNPNSVVVETENEVETNLSPSTQQQQQSSRTPFTSLSQIDADLALARTLQEQERAYLMLRMNGHVSDYGSSENGSYDYDDEVYEDDDDDEVLNHDVDSEDGANEEDAFDVHAHPEGEDNDEAAQPESPTFEDDEAYARYLQEAEEREMAIRLMAFAGLNDFQGQPDVDEDHDSDDSQQDWEEVDPDELSYEELIALGEVVGTESRGLSIDTIAALPSVSYKAQEQDGGTEQCVICRLEFDDGETLTALSCKHAYHPECINNWLQINKVCPVCSTEVSTSESTSS